jgi:uncharacterized iron-regulated protein
MRCGVAIALIMVGLPVGAGQFDADVVVLGELHDNPHHHLRQADIVTQVRPAALVFEMLTEAQAAAYVPGADVVTLEAAFGWVESGWPDFAMYYPIFAAASEARIDMRVFGAAVPRDAARNAINEGVAGTFGVDAAQYGLTQPLDPDQQAEREAFQMAAHCDALPPAMLPGMVDVQRLRDAQLARVALHALEVTGGPVVVITGNGHARADWGMPVYLAAAAPGVTVVTLGQGEAGVPARGVFDLVEDAPAVVREDPCLAFQ